MNTAVTGIPEVKLTIEPTEKNLKNKNSTWDSPLVMYPSVAVVAAASLYLFTKVIRSLADRTSTESEMLSQAIGMGGGLGACIGSGIAFLQVATEITKKKSSNKSSIWDNRLITFPGAGAVAGTALGLYVGAVAQLVNYRFSQN